MKKLIIAILVFIPSLLNAQSFWSVVNDHQNDHLSHVTDQEIFQDSILVVSGIVSDVSCASHILFAYDMKGQQKWSTNGSLYDVIYTDEDYIYTAGNAIMQDYGPTKITFAKYDNTGNEIFWIDYEHKEYGFDLQNIEVTGSGTVLISSVNSIVESNVNGTEIKEHKLGLTSDISVIKSITSELYLIATQEKIYKSTNEFTLTDSIQLNGNIHDVLLKNDTIYTHLDSKIIRLDTNLNLIDTLYSNSMGIQNMELYGHNLWVQPTRTDSIQLTKIEGSKYEHMTFPLFVNDAEFVVNNNGYTFVGNSLTKQIGLYHFADQNVKSDDVVFPDVELVDAIFKSITPSYIDGPLHPVLVGYHFVTEVKVKNNGTDTLTSFAIFADLYGGMNCAQNLLYQKVSDLKLLPGDIETVVLNSAFTVGGSEVCFQTLAPNSKLESMISNNNLCTNFVITGLEKKNEIFSDVKMYPNPMTDYLMLTQLGNEVKTIQIVDINGVVMIEKTTTEQSIEMKTSHLSSGVYLVKISSNDQLTTQLITKQ